MIVAGLSGYVIGKLSFKVRGAYFVIVTISFAEVDAAGRAELGGAHARAAGAYQHSALYARFPGTGRIRFWNKTAYYYLVALSRRSWPM